MCLDQKLTKGAAAGFGLSQTIIIIIVIISCSSSSSSYHLCLNCFHIPTITDSFQLLFSLKRTWLLIQKKKKEEEEEKRKTTMAQSTAELR